MAKRVVPVSFFLSMKDIKKVYGVEIKCRPAIKELIPNFFKLLLQPIMNYIIVRGKLTDIVNISFVIGRSLR